MTQGRQQEDAGLCLSMHQPWASLLVYGIKRIEGRGWASDHRGRLWIAATVKQPAPEEIQELEGFYGALHAAADGQPTAIDFPPAYPTGVLLGCVEVVDVVQAAQVEAWDGLPEGLKAEAGSPFCFLCQASQRLVVPHAMRGQHKMFPLERKIHKAAVLGLRPAPNSRGFSWADFGEPPAADAPAQQATRGNAAEQPPEAAAAAASQAAATTAAASAGAPQKQQDPQKRLRAVQKKLRQIAALDVKRREGLLPEEAAKLQQRPQLEAEAAVLQAALHT